MTAMADPEEHWSRTEAALESAVDLNMPPSLVEAAFRAEKDFIIRPFQKQDQPRVIDIYRRGMLAYATPSSPKDGEEKKSQHEFAKAADAFTKAYHRYTDETSQSPDVCSIDTYWLGAPRSTFFVAERRSDGLVVGCVGLQPCSAYDDWYSQLLRRRLQQHTQQHEALLAALKPAALPLTLTSTSTTTTTTAPTNTTATKGKIMMMMASTSHNTPQCQSEAQSRSRSRAHSQSSRDVTATADDADDADDAAAIDDEVTTFTTVPLASNAALGIESNDTGEAKGEMEVEEEDGKSNMTPPSPSSSTSSSTSPSTAWTFASSSSSSSSSSLLLQSHSPSSSPSLGASFPTKLLLKSPLFPLSSPSPRSLQQAFVSTLVDYEDCELRRLSVCDSARGTGVAQLLVVASLQWAQAQGFHALHLSTSETMPLAMKFYRKSGFAEVHSGMYVDSDYDWPTSHFRWVLAPAGSACDPFVDLTEAEREWERTGVLKEEGSGAQVEAKGHKS